MKKQLNWEWKTPDKILLYSIVTICFITSLLITKKNKIKSKYDVIASTLNSTGFGFLLIFQYKQKWIWGLTVVTILFLISIYITIYNFNEYKSSK